MRARALPGQRAERICPDHPNPATAQRAASAIESSGMVGSPPRGPRQNWQDWPVGLSAWHSVPAVPDLGFGAPVAQLDRVSGYEPEGREFESLQARQLNQRLIHDQSLLIFGV